ncbi:hypothetical protein D0Z07_2281 [Hyphodiscus hymeniophilus]|uniref:Uncharacterized protein n=1 Tax=Hyphodiscus hymeniophilus TaxID=353542 RepID=A0A9P6VMP8_9HELO|nr:hypothetical protein D0Z07_2281 [Hyphodiscus hymeniophilus]
MESSSEPIVETLCKHCTAQTLITCWELLFALLSSQINIHEGPYLQIQAFDPGYCSFILDPSPVLMLVFCIVLGCSVSSFCYRHQEQDRAQAPIFIFTVVTAATFGLELRISANVIMLELIPWVLCFSMVFSTAVHWLLRRCSKRTSHLVYEIDEKDVLLRH